MELIEIEQRPMTQDKMRQLADKVREAAYESVESLWSAVLDVVDMDTAQCFEQALAALLELIATIKNPNNNQKRRTNGNSPEEKHKRARFGWHPGGGPGCGFSSGAGWLSSWTTFSQSG